MNILILEPRQRLVAPYSFLPALFDVEVKVKRVESIDLGVDSLPYFSPELVLVSATFEARDQLRFLDRLKTHMLKNPNHGIIPIIFMVDVKSPLSTVLGTAWAGKSAVASTQATMSEFKGVVSRVVKQGLSMSLD